MIINSLSFCLGKSLSLIHIWRTVLLVIIFLVVSFFQHFENTTLLPSGMWGSCWELYWYRVEESFPICDKQLFSCYFLIFLYDFYNLIVTVSVWIYLGSSFLRSIGIYEPGCPFPSAGLGGSGHYFFEITFQFFLSYLSGTSVIGILFCLVKSCIYSLMLYSLFFIIFFSLLLWLDHFKWLIFEFVDFFGLI